MVVYLQLWQPTASTKAPRRQNRRPKRASRIPRKARNPAASKHSVSIERQVMKPVKWVIPVIAVLALTACDSSNTDSSKVQPAASRTKQLEEQREQQYEKERKEAERQNEIDVKATKAAQQKMAASLEEQVKAERSVDARLGLIVTKFCKLAGRVDYQQDIVYPPLAELFDKYWEAGGRWSKPLGTATEQKGGCPGYLKEYQG